MTNKEFFISCLKNEGPNTVAVIKALPEEKLDYKSDEKSRTARQIVEHLIGHLAALNEMADEGKITFENCSFKNPEDAEILFNGKQSELIEKIQKMDDKTWEEKIIPFYWGEQKIWEDTVNGMCWSFLFDRIHHRGQLSTYIRPMGGKNPSIYGPSADTM
jgi:uncharacterized damage-inducible protein DinB